jgi:predicted nucleic acid-binding protein
MIRVVVDTNVLVSGLIGKRHSPPKIIFEDILKECVRLVSTASTIAEVEDVLNRPQIVRNHKQSPEQIARFLMF